MGKWACIGPVTLAAGLLALGCPAGAAEPEVEAAFQAVQRAVEARDAAALEALVHPEYEMLHALGQIERRDSWIGLVRTGRLPRQTAEIREFGVTVRRVGSTAVRGSVVRFRDARLGRDMWLRGTATFVREGELWRLLRQQSTLLSDAPTADAARLEDYAGAYEIKGRDGFRIVAADGLLYLRWAGGAELPLIPQGGDRFGSGPTSHIVFQRNAAGAVASAERSGPEGRWWTAARNPQP